MGAAADLLESVRGQPLEALADLLAEDAEWWVAGDPARFPWAGSFVGPDGFRKFLTHLRENLDYQRFDIIDTIDGGDRLVQIVDAAGVHRVTGRPFASLIARTFEVRDGRLVRVRSIYDTAAYDRAVG